MKRQTQHLYVKRPLLATWFAVLILCGLFSACAIESQPQRFRIGFSQCCADAWRDVMNREMMRELAFHPELSFQMMVANGNSEKQAAQIREMVKSGVDLLIITPNESAPLTAVIEDLHRQNIPVILVDRKTETEHYTAFVGADNYEIGLTAARYLANLTAGKAQILELRMLMTISPAKERHQGFLDGVKAYPGMSIVNTMEIGGPLEPQLKELSALIAENPRADAIFGHTDLLAESAWKEAHNLGRAQDMIFVGIDGIPGTGQGIQAVEDGILDASLLYPTGGSEAIKLAFTILNHLPFEKNNRLQTTVINPGNAGILHSQMRKEASLQESIDKQIRGLNELTSIYRNQRIYIFILISSLLLSLILGAILWYSLQAKKAVNRDLEIKNKEVLEHEQQLVDMSDELKEATQAKVDFFTNISHEFRTPLTLILGYVEGLLSGMGGNLGKEVRKDHLMVRKNALRLLRLVNQLMDFRKIENGKMAVRASNNDLVGFTREIVEAYQKMADKRRIHLGFFSVEPRVPIWFDVNMLDKVLFNLLSNAFKFTADGGKIQVAVIVDPILEKAIVKVEDNGRGMSKEHASHAFERFYQGASHKTKGTGLGLSLSKELVLLHGGSIELWSESGKGSRFEVLLPLGKAHFREEQLIEEQTEGISYDEVLLFTEDEGGETLNAADTEKNNEQSLLLIEDNDELRHFLKKQFGKSYRILEATDGDNGLQIAFEEVPDIIIADINMPGRDGLTLMKILKHDLRTSHIPIVLLTARNSMEQKIEGIQTGADAYVTKPFNLVFLSEIVKNLLNSRGQLRERFSGNLQPGKMNVGIGNVDQQFLRKFTDFVEHNYADQNLSVDRMSEEFGLSRAQLFRKTKALLGESPNDFIQHLRLKKASQMLMTGKSNVAEIAYQTGYASPAYFSTAFRARFGCSPSEYKQRHS